LTSPAEWRAMEINRSIQSCFQRALLQASLDERSVFGPPSEAEKIKEMREVIRTASKK